MANWIEAAKIIVVVCVTSRTYFPKRNPTFPHHHQCTTNHLLLLLLLHSFPFPPPPLPPRTTPNQIPAIRSQSSHSSSFTHYQINDKFHRKKRKHNQNLNPKKERCKSAITMATRECETEKVGRIFRRFPLTVAAPFCSKIPFSLSLSVSVSLLICVWGREKNVERKCEKEREKIVVKVSEWVEWSVRERERERVSEFLMKAIDELKAKGSWNRNNRVFSFVFRLDFFFFFFFGAFVSVSSKKPLTILFACYWIDFFFPLFCLFFGAVKSSLEA